MEILAITCVRGRTDVLEVHSRNSDRLARTCRVAMFFLQSVFSEGFGVDRLIDYCRNDLYQVFMV